MTAETLLDGAARLLRANAWLRPLFLGVLAIGLGVVIWSLAADVDHLVAGLLTSLWGLLGFSIAATLPYLPAPPPPDASRWARMRRRLHRAGYALLGLLGVGSTLVALYLSLRLPFLE